jgi:two-component system sensor histidine kinase/response regulator
MLRILVVEDNLINQKITISMLKKFNMNYVISGNAQEALAHLQRESFDCILMDINLPDLNGIDVTNQIRNTEKTLGTYTPIIAVTGNNQPGDEEKILHAGFDYYISKPVNHNILLEVLLKIYEDKHSDNKDNTNIDQPLSQFTMQEQIVNRNLFIDNFHYFDKEVTLEILDMFFTEYPERLEKLKRYIASGDLESTRITAHSLKGVISNFSAPSVVEVIRKIEEDSRNQKAENLPLLLQEFTNVGGKMIEELKSIREEYVE